MAWGAHVCIFYETKQDLLDTAVAYFAAGLKSDEYCIWAVSDPLTEVEARTALAEAIPTSRATLQTAALRSLKAASGI